MIIKIDKPIALHELGQRDNQEDTIFPAAGQATADDRVLVVCDGMGGHEHGEVASGIVATTVGHRLAAALNEGTSLPDAVIEAAINEAWDRVDAAGATGSNRAMGTTLTLLTLHRRGATVAHIGDSRIYHLRPATGETLYWSRDHSLVMELWQSGEITREKMATHERRNVITRAITAGGDRVEADIVHITDIKPGDWFVLCTDGVLESVEHDELLRLIAMAGGDRDCLRAALVEATRDNKDNHSAYLVHVAGVELEAGDECALDDEASAPCNVMRFLRRMAEREAAALDVEAAEPDADVVVVEDNTAATAPTATASKPIARVVIIVAALLLAAFAIVKWLERAPEPVGETTEMPAVEPVSPVRKGGVSVPLPKAAPATSTADKQLERGGKRPAAEHEESVPPKVAPGKADDTPSGDNVISADKVRDAVEKGKGVKNAEPAGNEQSAEPTRHEPKSEPETI